jgi:hypothetical protein
MDFLGGALPNVMFIVGILAVGLGLGIELKLVPLNKEINRTGRVGAFVVGLALIAISIVMYANPSLLKRDQPASTAVSAAQVTPAQGQTSATTPPAPTGAPAATAAPAQAALAPAETPTATSVPSATPVPTATRVRPTPTPTAVPKVEVPDLHGLSEKDIKRKLEDANLTVGQRKDQCEGPDQGDPKAKKGHVVCQNPAPKQRVAPGTAVDYVIAEK